MFLDYILLRIEDIFIVQRFAKVMKPLKLSKGFPHYQ